MGLRVQYEEVVLFEMMEIERYDKDARQEWGQRGCRQFDAPASIVVLDHLRAML
ncbi:MAG: hypothetical protein HOI67_12420 [Gammaproteobacteria bacterium]|jgi:hypothetical protein|nr:hypothetical protein [Gammaproteobacteria bacterium]